MVPLPPLFQLKRAKSQTSSAATAHQRQRGATIIEILIATGVVGLVMTSAVATITVSLNATSIAKNKLTATKYNQEGVEYFRTQRNILGWETFVSLLNSPTYCLATLPAIDQGGIANLPARSCNASEFVDPQNVFQRNAQITQSSSGGENIVTISVAVTWSEGGRPQTSRATAELRNSVLSQFDVPVFIPTPVPLPSVPPGNLPAGAVVPFNLDSCPSGWAEFTTARGRMVIGTNPAQFANPYGEGVISLRTRNLTGGAETHTLTIAELPAHTHAGPSGTNSLAIGGLAWINGLFPAQTQSSAAHTGGDLPHNNMPPYLVMMWCKKN